jgi:hypothetical protein
LVKPCPNHHRWSFWLASSAGPRPRSSATPPLCISTVRGLPRHRWKLGQRRIVLRQPLSETLDFHNFSFFPSKNTAGYGLTPWT